MLRLLKASSLYISPNVAGIATAAKNCRAARKAEMGRRVQEEIIPSLTEVPG